MSGLREYHIRFPVEILCAWHAQIKATNNTSCYINTLEEPPATNDITITPQCHMIDIFHIYPLLQKHWNENEKQITIFSVYVYCCDTLYCDLTMAIDTVFAC